MGTGPHDVDFCSMTIGGGGGELNDDILQQKLQVIVRQREEFQQMEIELRARAIARSEILEVQNSFEVQLKEHMDLHTNLKVSDMLSFNIHDIIGNSWCFVFLGMSVVTSCLRS